MSNKKVNLAYALDYLELVLGQDWLQENLKVMKDSQCGKGGFGRNIDFAALGIAYVAKIWYKAREETIDLEIVGGGLPGPYSLAAAAIATDLEVLKDCVGLQTKIDELKDAKLSLKTVHELGIASGYAQIRYDVDFTSPKVTDWQNFEGYEVPLCVAGIFMAKRRGNKAMIICVDLDMLVGSGDMFRVPKTGDNETLYQGVLYLYVGETLTETETLLHKWSDHPEIKQLVRDYDVPVLVHTTGIRNINNQPAYVRRGRWVKDNHNSFAQDIYIPDEIITTLP